MSNKTLVAVLAATTMLAGGSAFAADQGQQGSQQAMTPPPGHAAVVKDFGKLSKDGVRAYQELTLARLAIFDGRTGEAKKYVDEADKGFNKAKSDESVFQQAEATMRTNVTSSEKSGQPMSSSDKSANDGSKDASSQSASSGSSAGQSDVNKQVEWLPVDGSVSINEDFTAKPEKAKAVAEANKKLASGDKKGAMDTLKLAEVDTMVTLAVVPLQQTITDVDAAKQLIDSGKFYEGSQKLKAVQDATLLTIADMPATAAGKQGSSSKDSSSQPQGTPTTH